MHQLTDSMKMDVCELSNMSPKDPLRQRQTQATSHEPIESFRRQVSPATQLCHYFVISSASHLSGDRVVQMAAATRRRWPGWPHDRQCVSNRRVNGSADLTCSLPLLTDYAAAGSPPTSLYAPAGRQCEQRHHRENVIRYAIRTSTADGSDGRDDNAYRFRDGLLPDHNCCRCLFGLAFYTDLVAYRKRFYPDLTEPFGRQGSELGVIFSTIILVYFMVLAPTLSFGALLSSTVSPNFSIPLCIFASGVAQCLFSLVGGQPLLIVGITGPMLILEICIKLVCDANQSFLPFMRLLTALYTSMFGLLAVLANAGWLVLRVRRSVNEIFNCFVSFYFILKALRSLFEGLAVTPVKSLHSTINNPTSRTVNVTNVTKDDAAKNLSNPRSSISVVDFGLHHARMVATLLLAVLTFTVCLWLQAIKRGRYCRRSVSLLFSIFLNFASFDTSRFFYDHR
ncbi:hypothetical protein P879_04176 [Paragonimus westermani]|uniref:Bicarbonate transporter-like transmembrane domain-containing protein n=1 Tax=Paragonimus westermani TaxID=34504 RepID=A0A8T0DMF5_9TREM|nr:hypothetical protein P879_04176 [Paragonimus westermani]